MSKEKKSKHSDKEEKSKKHSSKHKHDKEHKHDKHDKHADKSEKSEHLKKRKPEDTDFEDKLASPSPKKQKLRGDGTDENIQLDVSSGSSFANKVPLEEIDYLSKELHSVLGKAGFTHLFPVQTHTFEHILKGKDVVVKAKTGSGKTLAFVLPVLEKFHQTKLETSYGRKPRALILTPTRELAIQISRVLIQLEGGFSTCLLYGGTRYDQQEQKLRQGVDIVVGTPGRVIDHIERRNLVLDSLDYMILDEADEMLNFGFADSIEAVLKAIPTKRPFQTLLFSATMPEWVKNVTSKYFQNRSVTIDFVGNDPNQTATSVEHLAISCSYSVRQNTLSDVVKVYAGLEGRTLVFANTKAEANEIALNSSISADCQVLHGDIQQTQREITLNSFREGKFHVLVATDVAARGLDIDGVGLVIQTEPPRDHETYVHRAGRTGRAGKSGICVTFFTPRDVNTMKYIEQQTGIKFQRIGTPQLDQLVRVGAQEAIKKIDNVHGQMIPLFIDQARALIETSTAEDALAAALAVISGYAQPQQQRSLLSSLEGYTTIYLRSEDEIYSPRFVINILANFLQDQDLKKIKDIRLCEGGAVVEVPTKVAHSLIENQSAYNIRGVVLELCKELPELAERVENNYRGNGGGRGGGRGGRGGDRNSYGGRGGGGRGGDRNFGGNGGSRFGGENSRGGGKFSNRGGFNAGGNNGDGNTWRAANSWAPRTSY